MFGDGFEQSTILRTGPDGLTRVITSTWDRRESVLVEAYEAEFGVFRAVGAVPVVLGQRRHGPDRLESGPCKRGVGCRVSFLNC
jgi:hypothetical protein